MKNIYSLICVALIMVLSGCDKFLDQEPLSTLSPEQYLSNEENIGAYATDLYNILPGHAVDTWGNWSSDNATDNMAYANPSDIFAPGYWKVEQAGGAYSFTEIYRCNYFLNFVLPLYENGEITGMDVNIRHYIGEAYFFRAWCYFNKLKNVGDYPIVREPLDDDLQVLTDASKRAPRNEVARFILEDLDLALEYLRDVPPVGGTNRLNKDCVHLMKSRVALFEGTWLKYFKGTAFVPNGPEWPGAAKSYNQGYQYPSGDIDKEIEHFLTIAMDEAKIVADKYALTNNTGLFQASAADAANPYFDMFGSTNMSKYPEILLWRAYNEAVGVANSVVEFAAAGNAGYGTTKSMVDAFVMNDGTPIYASSAYPGDADIFKVTQDRDSRAKLFIKTPGDRNLHSTGGPESFEVEPYPNIINSVASMRWTTGYALRKGLNFNGAYSNRNRSEVGCIIFRAAEAYLNYIEACYEKNGSIDSDADRYWKAIRARAHAGDYAVSIEKTDMDVEKLTDWGAWSAGQVVDKTLFNIRRERRCELMAEGFRPADIRRWRAMDQMIDTPYHVYGVNLWDSLAENADFLAVNEGLEAGANVSAESFSKYVAPYHVLANNRAYNGYRWKMAHYLNPIAVQHFLITGGSSIDASPLYQNPGWPTQAGEGAIK